MTFFLFIVASISVYCKYAIAVVAYTMNVITEIVILLILYNNNSIVVQVVDIVVEEDRNHIID